MLLLQLHSSQFLFFWLISLLLLSTKVLILILQSNCLFNHWVISLILQFYIYSLLVMRYAYFTGLFACVLFPYQVFLFLFLTPFNCKLVVTYFCVYYTPFPVTEFICLTGYRYRYLIQFLQFSQLGWLALLFTSGAQLPRRSRSRPRPRNYLLFGQLSHPTPSQLRSSCRQSIHSEELGDERFGFLGQCKNLGDLVGQLKQPQQQGKVLY